MNKIFSYKMHIASLFCTLLIAFSHVYGTFYGLRDAPLKAYPLLLRVGSLSYLSMTFFFFMSAYWLYRNYTPSKYIEKVTSRFKSLIIPYVIFSIIGLLTVIYFNKEDLTFGLRESIDAIFFATYNGALWYLPKLMLFILFTPILFRIIKNKKLCITVILLTIVINYLYLPNYESLQYWLPVFLSGGYISYHKHEIFEHWVSTMKCSSKFSVTLFRLFLVIVVIFSLSLLGYITEIDSSFFYLTRMLSFPILLIALKLFPLQRDLPSSLQHSIFLFYCLHLPLRLILAYPFQLSDIHSSLDLILAMGILMGSIALVVYLLANMLRLYFSKIFRILTGGR